MLVAEVNPEEEHRLDKLLIHHLGSYSEIKKQQFLYFNPRLDILNLLAGTKVWVPENQDIKEIVRYRGYYCLVR